MNRNDHITRIFYLTASGNSLKVARGVAAGLNDAELVPIKTLLKRGKISITGEKIGLIFPAYCCGLPRMVREFIEKLEFSGTPYIFAVATHGGSPGKVLLKLENLLSGKKQSLSAGFLVTMPSIYIPLYRSQSAKLKNKILKIEPASTAHISMMVKENIVSSPETGKFVVNKVYSFLLHGLFKMVNTHMDVFFRTEDSCDGCGICLRVCPVKNITLKENKPVWHRHCTQCVACMHWCPKEAIQFLFHTKARKRYHHPEIELKDITDA